MLPQPVGTQTGMTHRTGTAPPPVLYLLHGLSDEDTTWSRRTSIERYVQPLGLAVVMPQVHRSLYVDEAYGGRYWTFLSEELPALVASLFRVSTLDRTPAANLPPLYLGCGTEDPVYPDNRAFETACARAEISLTTRTGSPECGGFAALRS